MYVHACSSSSACLASIPNLPTDYLTGAEAELEKYNAYTKIELPRLLRQYLEGTFSANLDPALMLDQVSRGVLDSQAKLFESYRALHSTQHPLKIDPTRSPENRGISGPDMSPLISHSPPMINVRQSSAPSGSLSSDMTDRHLENVRPDPAGPSQSNPALLQVASTVDTQDLAMSRRHDSALGTPPSPAECTSKAIFSMDSKPF